MSQNILEFIDGQRCADGRAQRQSLGADVVDGHTAILPSSLEAFNTEARQLPSCNEEDNSDSATVWPPEKIGQSACHTAFSHLASKEGERQQITMLEVTAAISVSLVIPLSANIRLTRLLG